LKREASRLLFLLQKKTLDLKFTLKPILFHIILGGFDMNRRQFLMSTLATFAVTDKSPVDYLKIAGGTIMACGAAILCGL